MSFVVCESHYTCSPGDFNCERYKNLHPYHWQCKHYTTEEEALLERDRMNSKEFYGRHRVFVASSKAYTASLVPTVYWGAALKYDSKSVHFMESRDRPNKFYGESACYKFNLEELKSTGEADCFTCHTRDSFEFTN